MGLDRRRFRRVSKGFTLMEMMMVVMILGIIVLLAIPRFGDLIRKSYERRTMNFLGHIRTAVYLYFKDNLGVFPTNINVLTQNNRYVQTQTGPNGQDFPPTYLKGNHSELWGFNNCSSPADTGQWKYVPNIHKVFICCTHTDSKGVIISSW